jgi:hypothetical protein
VRRSTPQDDNSHAKVQNVPGDTWVCPLAAGQSTSQNTENEIWPEPDLHVQLGSQWRLLSLAGVEQAAGYPFQQWYVATGIGRQLKPISKHHSKNIDPDKEHYLLMGVGYEYLRTSQSASVRDENRVTFDVTANFVSFQDCCCATEIGPSSDGSTERTRQHIAI